MNKRRLIVVILVLLVGMLITIFISYKLSANYTDTTNQSSELTLEQDKKIEELERIKDELIKENDDLKQKIEEYSDRIDYLERQSENDFNIITDLNNESTKNVNVINQLKNEIALLKEENLRLKNLDVTVEENIEDDEESNDLEVIDNEPITEPTPNKNRKVAYLTFDDGPSTNTLKILDILDRYNIKATFFVIGGSSEFYNNTIKEISDRGNAIGNHTYSHNYKSIYSSVDAFYKDFKQNEDNLYSILGYRPEVVRFPGGSNNQVSHKYGGSTIMKKIIKELDKDKYQHFDWNVSSTDAEVATQGKNKIIDSVINGAKNKNNIIILFHDSKPKTTTVDALPTIIERLQEMEFEFDILTKDSYTVQFEK
jgi:peptidoglycan/xylan/chitin deacetylase (PgdA/CDA1 family)/cell division protein FtsB